MIYVQSLVHKHQILILIPFILSLNLFFNHPDFNLLVLIKYLLFILSYSMAVLAYRRLYRLKQFEPLKQYLHNAKIESNLERTNQLTLSIIFSGLVLLATYLWIDLSIYGGLYFFLFVLFSFVFTILSFYEKIRLFDRYFNVVYIVFSSIIFQYFCFHYLFNFAFSTQMIFDMAISSIFLTAYISFDDMEKIYTSHQFDKKTIVRKVGIEKFKKVLYVLAALIYILLIVETIIEFSPFYLFPLFTIPMLVNIVFRIQKLSVHQFDNINIIFTVYIFFISFLISMSNFVADKFKF